MYSANHKINSYGIEGYAVNKQYQASSTKPTKESKEEQKRKETKRGHYLEDYAKIHGSIPGPTDYEPPNSQWTAPSKNYKQNLPKTKKMTFIA